MVGIMTFNRRKNSGKIDFEGPRKEIRVGQIEQGTSLQRSSDSELMDPNVKGSEAEERKGSNSRYSSDSDRAVHPSAVHSNKDQTN